MRPSSGLTRHTLLVLTLVLGPLAAGPPQPGPGNGAAGEGRAGSPVTPEGQQAPSLLVMIVVDQLPAELLDRYDPAFTGGLRRLRDEGLRFLSTTHDHAITETAPGHATLVTGTWPSHHGVVSNQWWEAEPPSFKAVLNVVDPKAPVLGYPQLPGASPAVLERDGLADWLQAANPDSRVVSVSGKARGAVLLASHSDADVFWFEPALGRFVTSTHYASDYPDWVTDF
ncbi:MAG: alkaline phosphatase family protein [Gemmatimonadota bacterium]